MIQIAGGPFFDDLRPGLVVSDAPTCTLTDGLAAAHAAIVGNRLRLSLDAELSRLVAGARLANPALVWDVAIGQSTLLTHRAIANLFYRGLRFSRFPHIGDTLRTATEVIALRQNTKRPGRAATGLAVLRIRTTDQEHREILDFMRCAMLPLRDPEGETTHAADLEQIALQTPKAELGASIADWRLDLFSAEVGSDHFADLVEGSKWEVAGGDMVTSAPELARLTLNVAMVHHDGANNAGGQLVYGGHTIGLAMLQVTRALPNLVTILSWHSCDHLGPVREGDTLRSSVELERRVPLAAQGVLLHLRSRVRAEREGSTLDVLDWRFVGIMA